MLSTLARRLIFSHVLPLLIILPLMGIALIYGLETSVLMPNLSAQARGEAELLAEIARDQPQVWQNPAQAQAFVTRFHSELLERVMLLGPDGRVLASSNSSDGSQVGQRVDLPALNNAVAGRTSVSIQGPEDRGPAVDVLAPVLGADGRVVGLVRLTQHLNTVSDWFSRLRGIIAGVLAAGLVLGGAVGWALAINLERPVSQVTDAVLGLATGQQSEKLPERGPAEIRMLARAFNTLEERLQTLEQNRRQLLSNLVHELGRPLGALHSAIQALERGAGEEPELRRELLAGMDEELGRLRRLLDDLARLHDQVAGRLELNRHPLYLSEWLPRVLAPRRTAAQANELRWEVSIAPDIPPVQADVDRLGQAVTNLVSNAMKYTPSGGKVSVGAGTEDGQAWIEVADTGPGISPEDQAQIFTPFYRGPSARRFRQGMGLGLSIARDLVTAHGGRLEVESVPGEGSRFTIWLPLAGIGTSVAKE